METVHFNPLQQNEEGEMKNLLKRRGRHNHQFAMNFSSSCRRDIFVDGLQVDKSPEGKRRRSAGKKPRSRKTLLRRQAEGLVVWASRSLEHEKWIQMDEAWTGKSGRTLKTSAECGLGPGLRLDLQGYVKSYWKDQQGRRRRFANLQLQANGRTRIGSTTLAQLNIEVGRPFPSRFFRRGFVESMNLKTPIWLRTLPAVR